MRHPLTRAVAAVLPRPRREEAKAFLALLDRRMTALERAARGEPRTGGVRGSKRSEHALARRFLRGLEGTWDDGDENLVRGYLDRWLPAGELTHQATARSLLEVAATLVPLEVRPGTLFFFLWEMESMLASKDGPC